MKQDSAQCTTTEVPLAGGASSRLRNSAIVFVGGACYGVVGAVVKFAYADGFTFPQVVCSQAFFATVVFALWAFVDWLRGAHRPRLAAKQRLKLAAMGLVTGGTTTFYYCALQFIPASVGITLLFQFTWLGLVFEVATTRRRPTTAALIAAAIIMVGTVMSSGIVEAGVGSLHPLGIVFGLLAAVCCASFMFLSGRVETDVPVAQRGLWACCGYLLTGFVLCPDYLPSGVLLQGIAQYGIILGPMAFVLPMVLFGIGCKHLSPGLSTVMAASELPISVALSVLFVHEAVTPVQLAGVGVILLGIVAAQMPAFRNR